MNFEIFLEVVRHFGNFLRTEYWQITSKTRLSDPLLPYYFRIFRFLHSNISGTKNSRTSFFNLPASLGKNCQLSGKPLCRPFMLAPLKSSSKDGPGIIYKSQPNAFGIR